MHTITDHKSQEGEYRYSSTLSIISFLEGWSEPHTSCSTPGKKDLLPTLQGAMWAPGLVGTGVENVTSTMIKFSDQTAHSELLQRQCYPSTITFYMMQNTKTHQLLDSHHCQVVSTEVIGCELLWQAQRGEVGQEALVQLSQM